MKSKSVSFVIPIYNMEKYLERCMTSILAQTFTNFEVIMIDDGSTDRSAIIAKKFLYDKRFKYIYQNNAGVSVARNLGISLSEGAWIAFVDPDDYLESNYLEELIRHISPDSDIIACCCKAYDSGKEIIFQFYETDRVFSTKQESNTADGKMDLYLELMDVNFGSKEKRLTAIGVPWGKLYRADFLKSNNLLFPVRLFRIQDNIFNMWAFDLAREIRYINRAIYIYNLDNIVGYNKKYNAKAPEYLEAVSNMRREFLFRKGYLENPIFYKAYCKEVYVGCNAMLTKYYLHPSNKMTYKTKVKTMKEHFSKSIYQEVFETSKAMPDGLARRIRLQLLAKGHYSLLILFQALVSKIQMNKLTSKRGPFVHK